MAKLRKLINDYGEVLDFNHKLEIFFEENDAFLRKHDREKYGPKTLLEEMPKKMTVSIGIKIGGRLSLAHNADSSTEQIFNGAEIHCVTIGDVDQMFFGFAIHLIIGNENRCIVFPLAQNKECCIKSKTASFNHKKKTISEKRHTNITIPGHTVTTNPQQVIIFSSRKDFNDVLALCQRAIQTFNDQLPIDSKLIANTNL